MRDLLILVLLFAPFALLTAAVMALVVIVGGETARSGK